MMSASREPAGQIESAPGRIDPVTAAFWAAAAGVIMWTLPQVDLAGGGMITIDLREIAMFAAVFGALLIVTWRGRLRLPRERELWVIFALFVWALFSVFWADWPSATVKGLIRFAGWIGFGLVVVASMRRDRERRWWVWVLEIAATIILLRVAAAYLRHQAIGREGWTELWNEAVAFTRYAETALPFMLYLALTSRRRGQIAGALGVIICVATVFLLGRRGSILVLALMLPLLGLMLRRLRGGEARWIWAILLIIVIGVGMNYRFYAYRFSQIGSLYQAFAATDGQVDFTRVAITLTMIDLVQQFPWLGIGWENFANTFMRIHHVSQPAYAHYLLFRYQVELGVIGTLLGIIWVALMFRRVEIARRTAARAIDRAGPAAAARGTSLREVYLFACASELATIAWFINRALLQAQAEYRWDLWLVLGLNIGAWYAVKRVVDPDAEAAPTARATAAEA